MMISCARRGREYGDELAPEKALAPASPNEPPRGLPFLCLNANISRQFEFLQNAWIANTKFSGLTDESDPLPGNRESIPGCPVTGNFTMPGDATRSSHARLVVRQRNISALLLVRSYAEIAYEQRPVRLEDATPLAKDQPESLTHHIFYFALEDREVPLPLGWMLSDAPAKSMQDQLRLDGEVVQNQSSMNNVLKTLPPLR